MNQIILQILIKSECAQWKLKRGNSINNLIETNKVDLMNLLYYKNFLNMNYHIIEIVRIKKLCHKFSWTFVCLIGHCTLWDCQDWVRFCPTLTMSLSVTSMYHNLSLLFSDFARTRVWALLIVFVTKNNNKLNYCFLL